MDAAERWAQTIDHDDVPTDPAAAASRRIAAEAHASDPSANQVDAAAATETIQAEAASHMPLHLSGKRSSRFLVCAKRPV